MDSNKKQRLKHRIRRVSFVLVKLYVLACVLMFVFQRDLIYSPADTLLLGLSQQNNAVESSHIQHYQTVIGKRLVRGFVTNPERHLALVYYGDSAESVELNAPFFAQKFPNISTYILPYPGFSGSENTPSEEGICNDGLVSFDAIARRHKRIILVGRGLGAAVATYIASERHVEKLILVTPFYSLVELMSDTYPYLPMRFLLRDTYKTWKFAANVSAPVHVLLAEYDQFVPAASSYRLFQSFHTPLEFKIIKQAGHNDIHHYEGYVNELQQFVDKGS